MRKRVLAAVLVSGVSSALLGQATDGAFSPGSVGVKAFPAAPRLAQRLNAGPATELSAAASVDADKMEAIRVWNERGGRPFRNGFTRRLPDEISVTLGSSVASKDGAIRFARGVVAATERGTVWSGIIRVENASRVRLHLENVRLPEHSVLWVYGTGETPRTFDKSLIDPSGNLWTPSVSGDTIHLEIEAPVAKDGREASFVIRELLELLPETIVPRSDDNPTCLTDANCVATSTFDAIRNVQSATAQLEFVADGQGTVCSGALLIDRGTTFTPYFLTANHCFDTQGSASSLEAFWDYKYESCVSTFVPAKSSVPRSNGSTLLSTSAISDHTLVRLNSVPGPRYYLGWNPTPLTTGTVIHRVSHPAPNGSVQPQAYSSTRVVTTGSQCTGAERPNFVYSTPNAGGTYGGSSGAPIVIGGGQVVGQLLGKCSPPNTDGCDATTNNRSLDGAFPVTYAAIKQFIDATGVQPQQCVPSTTEVCLLDNRFAVKVSYDDGSGLKTMTAIKYTGETGLFWFTDPGNIEILLKMVDACSFNQRFWVYAGGTTDVEVRISVRDSRTGTTREYLNPRGQKYGTVTDSSAFATCP